MRSAWRLIGLLSLLLLAGGCDTTQPLQLDQQTFHFEVRGVSASVNSYDIWDMYEDLNNNGTRDADEQLYLFCENTGRVTISPYSAPFGFTVEMSVLRAGQTQAEILTSDLALQSSSNLALYDDAPPLLGVTRERGPITIEDPAGSGIFRVFRFVNPRLVSAAREEVLAATTNPLYEFNNVTYGLGQGRCSTAYPGMARVDQQPQPLPLVLYSGDTLVVELRRATAPPAGVVFNLNGQPRIKATLLLDGREVSVNGDTVTTQAPGDGIKFSFTSL